MVSVKKVKNPDKVQKKKDSKAKSDKPVDKKKKKLQAKEISSAIEKKDTAIVSPTVLAKIEKNKAKKEQRAKLKAEFAKSGDTEIVVPEVLATTEALKKAVKNVTKAFAVEQSRKNALFDDDTRLLIQLQAVKYPTVPKRHITLNLPNSLMDVSQSEVCFIIADLDKSKKKDHDAAVEAFKEKLNKAGITFVKTIIPFTKLKKEYSTFDLQRKLANSYDLFLLDGRISSHVTGGVLRKAFQKRNKLVPVNLSDNKLKGSIETALFKTRYFQPVIPQLISCDIGTIKMKAEHVAENITAALEQLKKEYPGGWGNIKSIHLKPAAQTVVVHPLYISAINPNLVKVPVVESKKSQKIKKINEVLADTSEFKVSDDKLTKKRKAPAATEDDNNDEDSPKKLKTENGVNKKKKSKKDKKKTAVKAEDEVEEKPTNGTKKSAKMEVSRQIKPEYDEDDSDVDDKEDLADLGDSDDEMPEVKPKKAKADNVKKSDKKKKEKKKKTNKK